MTRRPRPPLAVFAPLFALLVLVAAAAFVLMQGGARRDPEIAGLTGAPLPAFALARLDGAGLATPADFAGKPYVINLFASWCAPCRLEHPLLTALAAEGVPILGVAYKDKPALTQGFLAELGDPFTVVGLDPEGRYGLELGVTGVPETLVIDAQGRIAAFHRGPLTEAVIAEKVRPALQGG